MLYYFKQESCHSNSLRYDAKIWPSVILIPRICLTNWVEFFTPYLDLNDWRKMVARNLDILYAAELIIETMSRIGFPGLWYLKCPNSRGGMVLNDFRLVFNFPAIKLASYRLSRHSLHFLLSGTDHFLKV